MGYIHIEHAELRRVYPGGRMGRNLIRPPFHTADWLPDGALDNPETRWQFQKDVLSYPFRLLRWLITGN